VSPPLEQFSPEVMPAHLMSPMYETPFLLGSNPPSFVVDLLFPLNVVWAYSFGIRDLVQSFSRVGGSVSLADEYSSPGISLELIYSFKLFSPSHRLYNVLSCSSTCQGYASPPRPFVHRLLGDCRIFSGVPLSSLPRIV